MDRQGLFLSLEGGESSGKTTQAALLRDYLLARDIDTILVREPGGTPLGELLRHIVLDPQHQDITPAAEVFIYAAARSQLVHGVIKPALDAGTTVIADRYLDSSLAYQGYGLGLDVDFIRDINLWGASGLLPNLTVLFDCDWGSDHREPADRIESRDRSFHNRVGRGYRELARADRDRFLVISGQMSLQEVHRRIAVGVDMLLSRNKG